MNARSDSSSAGFSRRRTYKPPVWQRSFTDHRIRDAEDFEVRCNYIHRNPVRANLAETADIYPFSSAKIEPPHRASNT